MNEKMNVDTNIDQFDELPDAPPKSTIRLSWVGKVSVIIVAIWVFLALFGPWVGRSRLLEVRR